MRALPSFLFLFCFLAGSGHAATDTDRARVKSVIDNAIRPAIEQYDVPGMAIAITMNGERYFYHAGMSSRETRQPVTNNTLFEIGSISKTFTATLATYAQEDGKLSLHDKVSKHLPELHGSSFERISLLNLATHTAGGLPLQVPADIHGNNQLMDYLRQWRPAFSAGTHRTYSNISIGLLGVVAAASMHLPFEDAIEQKLFSGLGLTHSYLHVLAEQTQQYAQGYTSKGVPARLNPGVLGSEAYGVKTNAVDMIRFVEANMQMLDLDPKLQRAVTNTHAGYFKAGDMTQSLIWEHYPYPVELKQLLSGISDAMVYESTPVTTLERPRLPAAEVMIHKTGSTSGFAAYVAFIPAKRLGIVMLANKNYPTAARVTAAYRILTALDKQVAGKR